MGLRYKHVILSSQKFKLTTCNTVSPLHVATKWGRANMVSLLLAHGAVIDCRTRDLLTPLHCAARSGHD
uniref:ANK_REP_REGION domain-containing protein n=1 Tax=Parascaris equorum TaxID=6256 RepID=A0A914R6E1_PAREQ